MSRTYFKLFANCIPVKGAKRSIICDLQRGEFDFIPNDLYNILKEVKTKSFAEIKVSLNTEDSAIVDEYFEFLVNKDYGFWCTYEERDSFPELDLVYQTPSIITNAIIDVDSQSCHDFNEIYSQLDDLGCRDLQLRFFDQITLHDLYTTIKPLINNRIASVQLLIQASHELTEDELKILCRKNMKVISVTVSGASQNKSTLVGVDGYTSINFVKEKILNNAHCGNVHYSFFTTNIQAFTESVSFNSCLNRKISIDIAGNIKNCPSMEPSYGLITNITFKDALKHPGFKAVWGINKDQIEECMDCEFRHICTDCRAYLKNATNQYSKPAKCSYNPYTATWTKKSPEN